MLQPYERAGIVNIRLVSAPSVLVFAVSCGLHPAPGFATDTIGDAVQTFQIEMGKGDEVLARLDLQIVGGKRASYERSWPLVADEFCEATRLDLRRASETRRIRVELRPLSRSPAGESAPQMMEVYASWSEYFGMPSGLDSNSCKSFPTTAYSTSVQRTVVMDSQQAVTLRGDRELYLKVVPK